MNFLEKGMYAHMLTKMSNDIKKCSLCSAKLRLIVLQNQRSKKGLLEAIKNASLCESCKAKYETLQKYNEGAKNDKL